MRLGIVNVERDILRGLTAKQFRGWEIYYELEPFNEERADYRAASICATLANVNRGKNQRPYKTEDFLLRFGDRGEEERPKQTRQQQWEMLKLLAAMHANDVPVVVAPSIAEPSADDDARLRAELEKARSAVVDPNKVN